MLLIVTVTTYEHYRRAELQLELRDYRGAAVTLERLLADADPREVAHGLVAARHLLARAYFLSAQLGGAETTARALLADDPTDGYAALLLSRTLQRLSRPEEAAGMLRLAEALGAPGTESSAITITDTEHDPENDDQKDEDAA